jgi:hypothetical protein
VMKMWKTKSDWMPSGIARMAASRRATRMALR